MGSNDKRPIAKCWWDEYLSYDFQGANQHTKRYIKQIKHFGYTMEICRGLREKVWKERMRYAVNRNFYKRVL